MPSPSDPSTVTDTFNIVEATIADHRHALNTGLVTSVELVVAYIQRIATFDIQGGLNAFTLLNPNVLHEAAASDAYRASGNPPRALEGIPYTLKDSYKYAGLTATNGSPALEGLMSNEDSHIASKLRAAGAVMLGKTNMPPMACGGMQRGLYGRAESPYNSAYLTAAYSSGSSNGAATSTAASMGVFGLGSETVSSGRSAASNNALVVYTPSRGLLSCRGLWPLYVTCDVPTPMARTVADLLEVLDVIVDESDEEMEVKGDFWRQQAHVQLPLRRKKPDYRFLTDPDALKGKRIGVPKMYIGKYDSHPNAKPTTVNLAVIDLWHTARADLEALGAEVVECDFPLVTHYEDDSVSGQANNIVGAPENWSQAERAMVVAKSWDDFLKANADTRLKSLADVDTKMLFPKPENYVPDTFLEVRNLIPYDALPGLAEKYKDTQIVDLPGMAQAVKALEAQRKRDFEQWLDSEKLDCVVFPAQGDVGKADLEFNLDSARYALQNGVRYSNGNRAIRHLGVPTVSVPMGVIQGSGMPVNLTIAGKAYQDETLFRYAFAYENGSRRKVAPPLVPTGLQTDKFRMGEGADKSGNQRLELTADVELRKEQETTKIHVSGTVEGWKTQVSVEVLLDGQKAEPVSLTGNNWELTADYKIHQAERLDWSLKPMPPRPVMVLVVARTKEGGCAAKLLWAGQE